MLLSFKGRKKSLQGWRSDKTNKQTKCVVDSVKIGFRCYIMRLDNGRDVETEGCPVGRA